MLSSDFTAVVSSAAVILASFGNMATTVFVAARSYRDKKAFIVDERQIQALEDLWTRLQTVSENFQGGSTQTTNTQAFEINQNITEFLRSSKSMYISKLEEDALNELKSLVHNKGSKEDMLNVLDELKRSMRGKLR